MKNLHFFCASFFSLLTLLYCVKSEKSNCLEKEKTLGLLETAEELLSKAEDSYPSCNHSINSTDQSECKGKKSLAYIQISKKIISDVKENLPSCIDSKVIVEKVSHRDCSEILGSGSKENGVYTIWLSEFNATGKHLQVYCDMETDGGGWTVIQRRGKFAVQQDFNQDWETYKNGFGNITEEFWLGNENIQVLCQKGCEIRFDLKDEDGLKRYAVYKSFKLTGSDYTLNISNYTGDAGDGMKFHNNLTFSTKDRGDTQFAKARNGGWWYTHNDYCQPNGLYKPGESSSYNIYWLTWRGTDNLASIEIKVKPN